MKIKVKHFNGKITEEEITPIYRCQHVIDTKYYPTLKDVKFDETSEYIFIEYPDSCYGFLSLWLKDRKNKIYEYAGFGHSGAASVICSLLQKHAELVKENAELKEKIIKLSEEKGHLIVKNNTLEEANQSLSVLGTDLASANEIVRKEFFRADKNKDKWREKAENLQKTLQEIKNFLELPEFYLYGKETIHDRILQKITKAEVGE